VWQSERKARSAIGGKEDSVPVLADAPEPAVAEVPRVLLAFALAATRALAVSPSGDAAEEGLIVQEP
jgi:hypothetical protein